MRFALVVPALALSATLCAQQPSSTPTVHPNALPKLTQDQVQKQNDTAAAQVVMLQPVSGSCPVAFTAQRTRSGEVVQVDGDKTHTPLALALSLTGKAIATADVTIVGIVGPHLMAAGTAQRSEDARERFTLTGNTERTGPVLRRTVYTRAITGIRYVQLDSLKYADGTSWTATSGHACRVVPGQYLLVNGAAR